MGKRLFQNPAFVTGFLILAGMFIFSILYWLIQGDKLPQVDLLKDGNGNHLKVPYSPIDYFPLGTDNFNRNMFLVILVGAKYTIGSALIISLARVIPSFFIGLFIHFFLKRSKKLLVSMVDLFNYFPQTLLAFLLLEWMLISGPLSSPAKFTYSYIEQIIFYIFVIVSMGLPSMSLLFSNEINKIMENEFIESAKVLGASKKDLIIRHIRPFIIPQILVIWIREFITIMILISHLGMMGIFIGGAVLKTDYFSNSMLFTKSNEWSGLLGSWISFLWTTYPWIAFIPVIFFTLTIFSAKLLLKGITNELVNTGTR